MAWLMKRVAAIYLWCAGWRADGEPPDLDKYVLIAAPHTTNWDLPHMLAIGFHFQVPIRWLGKHTLFGPWWGWFMRLLGGMPVDRRQPGGVVGQVVERFATADRLVVVVPPEGTRGAAADEFWKSGFYNIARGADVPIVLGFLDYARKRGGFGPAVLPSGDVVADMDRIRAFYADVRGKYPERFTTPRLREEVEGDAAATGG